MSIETKNGNFAKPMYNTVKFKTLKIGQEFECYGDVTIKYNYPKICRCIKDGDDSAHEIDGVNFYIGPNDFVFVNIA